MGILKAKVGDPRTRRKVALEGHRFSPKEALEAGLVDHLASGNTEAIIAKAVTVAKQVNPLAREGVWGIIKASRPTDGRRFVRRALISYFRCLQSDLYKDCIEMIALREVRRTADSDDALAKARL